MEQTHNKLYVFLIYVVLVLATIIAFEKVRFNDFVNFDDYVYITQNPNVRAGLTSDSILWAFTGSYALYS